MFSNSFLISFYYTETVHNTMGLSHACAVNHHQPGSNYGESDISPYPPGRPHLNFTWGYEMKRVSDEALREAVIDLAKKKKKEVKK